MIIVLNFSLEGGEEREAAQDLVVLLVRGESLELVELHNSAEEHNNSVSLYSTDCCSDSGQPGGCTVTGQSYRPGCNRQPCGLHNRSGRETEKLISCSISFRDFN